MRILVSAVGTHGDVQPAVALAMGLSRTGYEVHFSTHRAFAPLVAKAGVELLPMWDKEDPRETMGEVQRGTIGKSANLRLFNHLFRREAPAAADLARQIEICRGHDFVLSSLASIRHAAESLGIPTGVLGLYPTQPTGEFPHHLSRLRLSWMRPVNRLSHLLFEQLFWQPERVWVNRWRTELQLEPVPWRGPARWLRQRKCLHLYGYSPMIIPKPKDWGNEMHVTGFWFFDAAEQFDPPPALRAFLENGPPPIVIGFGSLVDPDPAGLERILYEALAATGERAIILSGWSSESCRLPPPNVFHAGWVPFPWLLKRAKAIIHHSGAGTMSEAVRAGIPSVAVPYSGEQSFWANRLCSLNASPKPIPRLKLSVKRLTDALRMALGEKQLHRRVNSLSQALNEEDGVANAVAAFQLEIDRLKLDR